MLAGTVGVCGYGDSLILHFSLSLHYQPPQSCPSTVPENLVTWLTLLLSFRAALSLFSRAHTHMHKRGQLADKMRQVHEERPSCPQNKHWRSKKYLGKSSIRDYLYLQESSVPNIKCSGCLKKISCHQVMSIPLSLKTHIHMFYKQCCAQCSKASTCNR